MPRKNVDISSRIDSVVSNFGQLPLAGTPLGKTSELTASPEIILAMAMDAMVKSRPISHDLAQRTTNRLIEQGYHHIDVLSKSTWEERTDVLREGGYNRYREQCSTNLGSLADLVTDKYDGDLNHLLQAANGDREDARALMKEVKGVGDLGVELFFNNVQSVWPDIAPFLDSRSLNTAAEIEIGQDLDAIYGALGRDPKEMSVFANGLSTVRLEKKHLANRGIDTDLRKSSQL
ncbi:hypothetical protein N7468_001330 [Penicillium chermesinum]|uniref:Uncharacterized protein n=1 Tax=Penicillium chermesinum TaxID=63820 RepID=A0A9W9PHP2_9EURO|nr:uncharacterized protein N7468_001330 [Penicillium chermesinum]KAJ5246347.1 hypothetical protein N7468_001330 [Penicillium chermesinum]